MTHPLHVTLPSVKAGMGDRASLYAGSTPDAPKPQAVLPEAGVRDRPRRFLVLGGDSDSNLGDHAILHGLCLALVHWTPDAQITVTSHLSRHQVLGRDMPGVGDVVPRGSKGLLRLLAAALRSDRIVLGGGGLLQDDDSRVKMPYWAARLALLAALNGSLTS
ncbi:MAG: hypothetical protein LAT50_18320, partial [Ectothiorhodospiraceae bacterium]|nr:hypothetical protein [Ectothiorhodospiraceae bacterium]